MKLFVLSDTRIVVEPKKRIFNAVKFELDILMNNFIQITVLGGFYANQKSFNQLEEVDSENITLKGVFIPHRNSKFLQFKYAILLLIKSFKYIRAADVVHVRGPGIPMFIGLLYSFFFRKKVWWFKYANNWVDSSSFFWRLQKVLLKRFKWIKVTINGVWSNQPQHIVSFENPCLIKNNKIPLHKCEINKQVNIIYVGRLTAQKGVPGAIEALKLFASKNQSYKLELTIIGEGELESFLRDYNTDIPNFNVRYLGSLSKNMVLHTMGNSDLIILPTRSPEGFPKVIAEAMSVGCIPVVTNVSCIEQYVENNKNGFIIDCNNKDLIVQIDNILTSFFSMNADLRFTMRLNSQDTAFNYFTYERFFERVNNFILN